MRDLGRRPHNRWSFARCDGQDERAAIAQYLGISLEALRQLCALPFPVAKCHLHRLAEEFACDYDALASVIASGRLGGRPDRREEADAPRVSRR